MEATLWVPAEPPRPLAGAADEGIRWVDLEPGAEPDATLEPLRQLGVNVAGSELDAVLALSEDDRCGLSFRDGTVRLARAFSVELPATTPLRLLPVNLLAGEGWLITCCRGRVEGDVRAAVSRRWADHDEHIGQTAADLGVMVLHELALTYAPAHRALRARVERWELDFYRDERVGEVELVEVWGEIDRLRRWVEPLNRSGIRDDIDKAWFRGVSHQVHANNVDKRIDRTLRKLSELSDVLRSAFAALHTRRQEGRQRRLEYLATIFLVPTLVVGFFGANTKLPGGNETWGGFVTMVAAIVILTLACVAALHLVNRRRAF